MYLCRQRASLLFNTLSRFVIDFLPKGEYLLISWLQSLSTVILEPKKIKFVTAFISSPIGTGLTKTFLVASNRSKTRNFIGSWNRKSQVVALASHPAGTSIQRQTLFFLSRSIFLNISFSFRQLFLKNIMDSESSGLPSQWVQQKEICCVSIILANLGKSLICMTSVIGPLLI